MKKILFVMLSLYNGGAEKSLVNLLNEIPRDMFEIDLLLFRKEGVFLSQIPSWVNILDTPSDLRKLYAKLSKAGDRAIIKIVGTFYSRKKERDGGKRKAYRWNHFYSKFIKMYPKQYDVAVAYGSGEVLYYVNDKIQADRKLVWIHNDYVAAHHPKEYDHLYLKNMDGIVSISDRCVEILRDVFPEFKSKIYNIQNITSSAVIKSRANEFLPEEYIKGVPILLSIGRLTYQKGFDLAIEAARILKEKHVSFIWYIIGDGILEKGLKNKIELCDVSDCFKLLGVRENPYPYIKNCTIFVQPSRYEGKSVVLDETKILAKPIIVTNYPTVRDQIQNGSEGIIVEKTPMAIAEGIEELINDQKKQDSLHQFLEAHEYGNQSEVNKYIRLFNNDLQCNQS